MDICIIYISMYIIWICIPNTKYFRNRYSCYIYIYIYNITGISISEVFGMQFDDVDKCTGAKYVYVFEFC